MKKNLVYAVDDEITHGVLAECVFKSAIDGCDVLVAKSSQAARDLFSKHGPPRLLVTDGKMPDTGDGIELIKHFRKCGYDGPVIYWSGSMPTTEEKQELESMRVRILNKPCDFPTLVRAIRDAEKLVSGGKS